MMGDYRFGNYARSSSSSSSSSYDDDGDGGACRTLNVSRDMCRKNDGEMVRRALKALERMKGGGEGVRVLPWDLIVREESGANWFEEYGGGAEQVRSVRGAKDDELRRCIRGKLTPVSAAA